MFDIGTTTMSSKGQVVIPVEVRGDIREGDRFVVIRSGENLVLKPAKTAEANFAEDLIAAKRAARAWQDADHGKTTRFKTEGEMRAHFERLKAPARTTSTRRTRN